MTIIDRYLLIQFSKIFLICLISLSGLYMVIHVFSNLDEVTDIAGSETGGARSLVVDFYGPRVVDFFNRMSGVLILVAGVFSIAMMQRRRETTALEAAGITKARLVRPVLFAAILVIAAAAICRELYIPQYKSTLVRSMTHWTSAGVVPMNYQRDFSTGIMVQGDSLVLDENRITDVQLTLPARISPNILKISAANGIVMAKSGDRPAGLHLIGVIDRAGFANIPNIECDGRAAVYTPHDNSWLEPDQLFVACDLNVQEMAYGSKLTRYSSLPEMIESLKNPSRRFGLGDQVAIHERILKPLMEFTLVLIGLPLVICNPNRNIFVAAAACTLIVLGIELTTAASHAMGPLRMIQPVALSVWLPLLIFLPLSVFSIRKLFD